LVTHFSILRADTSGVNTLRVKHCYRGGKLISSWLVKLRIGHFSL